MEKLNIESKKLSLDLNSLVENYNLDIYLFLKMKYYRSEEYKNSDFPLETLVDEDFIEEEIGIDKRFLWKLMNVENQYCDVYYKSDEAHYPLFNVNEITTQFDFFDWISNIDEFDKDFYIDVITLIDEVSKEEIETFKVKLHTKLFG